MPDPVFVLLPPSRAQLASVVTENDCTPIIDATGSQVPDVPAGAWVRTRPGRPAPGQGPVILAEYGAPVPGRPNWLETTAPRDVPQGFEGLVLKGNEAGGAAGQVDGLTLLAQCPQPEKVLLDAGLGPHTAAAAAALGARGILLSEQLWGCPEFDLPSAMGRRLDFADTEQTRRVRGLRIANGATSSAVRALVEGADAWSLIDGLWENGDPNNCLWLAGQGLALARGLADRYGTLGLLLKAYQHHWEHWEEAISHAEVTTGNPADHTAALVAGAAATADGLIGSGVLWEIAAWLGRPIMGGPLKAALATGRPVVAAAADVQAIQQTIQPAPDSTPVHTPAPAPTPSEAPPAAPTSKPAIAIIGLGCRLPDANSIDEYWENIVNGRSSIREVPADRWDVTKYTSEDPNAPDVSYTCIGGFIDSFDFNPRDFRIPPKVATQIDPVQKFALASVADALTDANLKRNKQSEGRDFNRERCAVILGNSLGGEITDQYAIRLAWPEFIDQLRASKVLDHLSEPEREQIIGDMEEKFKANYPIINEDSMPGELANVIAGRIANAFDLGGANYTVDAACASSMAAIQTSVKSLQDGEHDLVITGGADRSMGVPTYVKFCKIGALSPDHSAPFDASANGFVMGEGCGILILKRYEDAVRDGDNIYAVIRGIGSSSDGKGKGITAPNIHGQIRALRRAYEDADLDPCEIDLFECHGTSTVVGDRVEVEALSKVIGKGRREERGPARIGSVKSMIGHLKSAAGAAACIKAALALKHKTLPPSINFETPREDVPFADVPLQVQTKAEPWPEPPDHIRRCGVSAFGFGGTNFHIVLEAYADQQLPAAAPRVPTATQPTPLPAAHPAPAQLSAPDPSLGPAQPVTLSTAPLGADDAVRQAVPAELWATSADDISTLIANLKALRRGEHVYWNPSSPYRIAGAGKAGEDREAQLDRAIKTLEKGSNPDMLRARAIHFEDSPFDGKLAFCFTGQGSQYLNMGLDLAEKYPIVANTFKEADEILTPILGRPITDYIRWSGGDDREEREEVLKQTEYSQPATLTVDIAILRLLAAYGVYPDMVAGHSLGEYGAAVAAGVMTFEDSLRAVSARGREMASIQLDDTGKMAGIATNTENVEEILAEVEGYVVPANKNCPTQTVIAGASDAVEEAIERFRARGFTVYPLPVSHAFHSAIVQPASEPLRLVLRRLGLKAPVRPITTNVTAEYYPTGPGCEEQIIDILARQIFHPVEWVAQVERMYEDGARAFVECGPKRALTGFAATILKRHPHRAYYTNHPKRGGTQSFLDSLAGLLAAGFPVRPDASELNPDIFASPEPRRATTQAIQAHLATRPSDLEALPELREKVVHIIAKCSGYEAAELDLDYELEADLGIDTVKQAEIFSVVRSTWGIQADPEYSFAKYRTIRAIIDWTAERIGAKRMARPRPALEDPLSVAHPRSQTTLVDNNVVSRFLESAANASLEGLDAEAFATTVLPAVQELLNLAYNSGKQAQSSAPKPEPVPAAAPPAPAAPAPAGATSRPAREESMRIVCSGASVGLPGGKEVFDPKNFCDILSGQNRITHIGARAKDFLDLNLVRLVKDSKTGQGSFLAVDSTEEVIRLAGVKAYFNLEDYGVSPDYIQAFDITTKLAFAAGIEALRDAGIPLVRRYKLSQSGKTIPTGWQLPEPLRDTTGIIFGSAFPGYDELIKSLRTNGADANGNFNRRFLFQILSMGHSQFAQFIGARGPNTAVNAACASTAQAIAMGADWIKVGRCERVIVIGADDVTSEEMFKWIGGGFMAAGAATTHDVVEEAALPFDRRRHGMILGMGAAGLVLESAQACAVRGVLPIAELLGSTFVNSAFHGTRLDSNHIATVMDDLIRTITAQEGITAGQMAENTVFLSHETYTPARGGSSASEINALFTAFGDHASKIVISNTKGYTGHPMGAGIEDSVAIKALQYGIAPPIANLKEPDEALGDLTLSTGEPRDYRYAVRLAAGFGSQLAITVWKAIAHGDDRVPVEQKRAAWLRSVTGYAQVEESIEQRTLRVSESTLDKLLALVPDVSPARLRGQVSPKKPTESATTTAPAAQSKPAALTPPPTPRPTAPVAGAKILDDLLELIAEKTGYATEELEIDFELEADLGIDTVKQAEIFSGLAEQHGLERNDDFRLADYPTIEALAGYVQAQVGARPATEAEPSPVAPAAVAPAPTPTQPIPAPTAPPAGGVVSYDAMLTSLVELISEKTGYATEELEIDFELEADLGIDTVKQAEIFSEISEKYALARNDDFSLADYATIEALTKYLTERVNSGGDSSATTSPAPAIEPAPAAIPTPTKAPAPAETPSRAAAPIAQPTRAVAATTRGSIHYDELLASLLELISDKTGYATDELEIDFELEADLGIDTVKQAEIFAEISEKYSLAQDDDFSLADYATIEALAKYLTERVNSGAGKRPEPVSPVGAELPTTPGVPQAPTVAKPAVAPATVTVDKARPTGAAYEDTYTDLLTVVSEKTGYSTDELEADFELEADLGIDTVKQAEVFSELQEKYQLERDDDFRLADHPTIENLARYLNDRRQLAGGPVKAKAVAGPVPVDSEPAPTAAAEPAPPKPSVTEPALVERPPLLTPPLPESFRLRRPILVEQENPGSQDLFGVNVNIIGAGPLARACKREIERRGGSTEEPWNAVLDTGASLDKAFTTAQSLNEARPARWITITRLGGLDQSFDGAAGFAAGARAGFTKALGREWEDVEAAVVDISPKEPPASVAKLACNELGAPHDSDEVFYRGEKRNVISYESELPPEPKAFDDDAVVLITGGARGICARIAIEIARRGPVKLALVGRGEAGDRPLDIADTKAKIKALLKEEGIRVTPAAVERQLQPLKRAEEIRLNMEKMRSFGAEVTYFRADLADSDAVRDLVKTVTEEFGTIDVAIHGAGIEESRLLTDKTSNDFHRVFDGKALGGRTLFKVLPTKCFRVSMGSVAGRFGNAGQVDYSAANDAMARLCLSRKRSLHVDWTAWDDVGMAVRGGMKRLLEDRGVELLPADAGAGLLIDLVAHQISGELVVAGNLGGFVQGPTHPLLDSVERDGNAILGYRDLSTSSDPWLEDHSIDGVPVLPGVIGLELMVATASLLKPGQHYTGAREVSFQQPLKTYRDGVTRVLVIAEPDGEDVVTSISSTRTLRTGRIQRTEHFRARLEFNTLHPTDNLPSAFLPDETVEKEAIYQRFFHGPIFQVLTEIDGVSSDGLLARAVVDHAPIGDPLLSAPLLLEAAFQAAGIHEMLEEHRMGLPSSIDEVRLLGPGRDGERLSLMIKREEEHYDIDIDGESGPLMRVRGYRSIDTGPLRPMDRFPVPKGGRPACFPAMMSAGATGAGPAIARADAEEIEGWLTPKEVSQLSQRGTKKRIRDRIAGRIAAKRAVAKLTGARAQAIQIASRASGEPFAIVERYKLVYVSISHREGQAIAVADHQRIGIDLEAIEERDPHFTQTWFRDDEQRLVNQSSLLSTVAWSIKEAVLKVLGRGMALSPHEIAIRTMHSGVAEVQLFGAAALCHRELGEGVLSINWTTGGKKDVIVTARLAA
jgi:malonyl CoA-acyl carrier protein transacylase